MLLNKRVDVEEHRQCAKKQKKHLGPTSRLTVVLQGAYLLELGIVAGQKYLGFHTSLLVDRWTQKRSARAERVSHTFAGLSTAES
jgi:hypothetical protein